MNTDALVGDIVTHWHKYGERRKTVAFAVDVAHSIHIRDEFVRAGVRAEHIDGKTPKPERDAILDRLRSGDLELVTNCMVLTEGWDMPDVSCCILARPTKKMGLYRQMLGRTLRAAEGKTDAIVLDHSGAVFRHGLAEDPVEWTLDPDQKAVSKVHEAARVASMRSSNAPNAAPCVSAAALSSMWVPAEAASTRCRLRRWRPRLGRIEARLLVEQRRSFYGQLRSYALERGHKSGWAAHKYREKFGDYPAVGLEPASARGAGAGDGVMGAVPTIAWAKSRNNPANEASA